MRRTKSKVRKAGGPSGCLMWGFFGVFVVVGLGLLYVFTLRPLWLIWDASSWQETTCTIETSEVKEIDTDDGETYKVAMTYAYQAQGQVFEGDRYDFSWGSSSGYDGKREIVDEHPPGTEVACFFDPDEPTTVVIDRGAGAYLWWGLFPLPFLGGGLFGLLWMIFAAKVNSGSIPNAASRLSSRSSLRSRRSSRRPAKTATASRPVAPMAASSGGAVSSEDAADQKARDDLMQRALGALGGLEQDLTPPIQRGPLEFSGDELLAGRRIGAQGLTVVTGIFAVLAYFWPLPMLPIALIVAGFAVYFWMQLHNPVPSAHLAESYLVPGSTTELRWQFKGEAKRIRKLVVSLEGRESATYRRGTSTYTDHHVFHEQPLAIEKGPQPRMFGNSVLEIPAETMPSFSSENNSISWRIRFQVDVERWPDIDEDFDISVFAPSAAENAEEGLS